MGERMEGVWLCDALDLPVFFGEAAAARDDLRLRLPGEIGDPAAISFALAWKPGPDAFDPYPNLRMIHSIASGVEPILSHPGLPEGVPVVRVRDRDQIEQMAGFAAWNVVWHHRGMRRYVDADTAGRWDRQGITTLDPPRAVPVGVLGFGSMGQAVARAVAALGFPVIAACTRPREAPAPGIEIVSGEDAARAVAARSRILVNLLPLTAETRGLIDANFLAAMPRGAALVNLARGDHLDEGALLAALESGHLAGASLDVFAEEPLPKDHPFWGDPRVLITPHEAAMLSARSVIDSLAEALDALRAGRAPENIVDRERGY